MKKSHRKDVIIARIIFVFIVLVLVVLIVFGVKAILKYTSKDKQPPEETQAEETTQQEEPELGTEATDDNNQWIVDDSQTQEPEPEPTIDPEPDPEPEDTQQEEPAPVVLEAMYGVNIRSGPGTDNDIIGTVELGSTIILLEKRDDGWGYIQKGDLTGYVYLKYFSVVETPDGT